MKIVISCHVDTVFKEPYGRVKDGIFEGATDNFASMLASALIIDDPRVIIEYTEEEEMHMDGARYAAKRYNPKDTFMIVMEVTEKKAKHFTIENIHGIEEKHIRKALKDFKGQYRIFLEGTESEAWLYKSFGYACLEVCVPVHGGVHSLNSKAYIEDIRAVGLALKALTDYLTDKERKDISDIYAVGEEQTTQNE